MTAHSSPDLRRRAATTRFGDIDYDESDVLFFPDGLVGFPSHRHFLLRRHGDGPLYWLQSLEDGALAFPVTQPRTFLPDYRPLLTADDRHRLDMAAEDEAALWTVFSVPKKAGQIRLHLNGPLWIHERRRMGCQAVLSSEEMPTDATVRVL